MNRQTELERAVQWLEYLLQVKEANVRAYPHRAQDVGAVHHCRVLLDALRWVPVSERLPTEDDSDEKGYVMTLDTSDVAETFEAAEIENWNKTHDRKITHWMRLPPKPEGRG